MSGFRSVTHLGGPVIRAELMDGLTEALMAATNAAERAAVVRAIMLELYASVEWLQNTNSACDAELMSLHTVLAAADEHCRATQITNTPPAPRRRRSSGEPAG